MWIPYGAIIGHIIHVNATRAFRSVFIETISLAAFHLIRNFSPSSIKRPIEDEHPGPEIT